jgi:hypothetical protein
MQKANTFSFGSRFVLFVVFALAVVNGAAGETFIVDRLTDTGEGKGIMGDLRYCITQANAMPGDDTITFAITGTINLTSALPDLTTNIDIQRPGPPSSPFGGTPATTTGSSQYPAPRR